MRRRDDLACLYDDGDRLSPFWRLGAKLNRTRHDIRALDVAEAYERLAALGKFRDIRELHVWGHGRNGAPLIGDVALDPIVLQYALKRLKVVWWRSCSVHRGRAGAYFAERVADLGITSVGHCRVISSPNPLRQAAICALRPGEEPWWHPEGDGLRGVATLRMTIPDHAYSNGVA